MVASRFILRYLIYSPGTTTVESNKAVSNYDFPLGRENNWCASDSCFNYSPVLVLAIPLPPDGDKTQRIRSHWNIESICLQLSLSYKVLCSLTSRSFFHALIYSLLDLYHLIALALPAEYHGFNLRDRFSRSQGGSPYQLCYAMSAARLS
jgi:hypothetical protein